MKTIEIDDNIFKELQKLAFPFIDNSPKMVIKRLVEHYRKCEKLTSSDSALYRRRRSQRGYGKLSNSHYRGPIIEALNKLGGAGNVDEVLEIVFSIVSHKLSEIDLSKTLNGSIRWRITAHWERHLMVKDGILKADSPRGIWELTPKYIEQEKKNNIKSAEATDTEA